MYIYIYIYMPARACGRESVWAKSAREGANEGGRERGREGARERESQQECQRESQQVSQRESRLENQPERLAEWGPGEWVPKHRNAAVCVLMLTSDYINQTSKTVSPDSFLMSFQPNPCSN